MLRCFILMKTNGNNNMYFMHLLNYSIVILRDILIACSIHSFFRKNKWLKTPFALYNSLVKLFFSHRMDWELTKKSLSYSKKKKPFYGRNCVRYAQAKSKSFKCVWRRFWYVLWIWQHIKKTLHSIPKILQWLALKDCLRIF